MGALFATGAILAGTTANLPGCRDETCWLPNLAAGSAFGNVGGVLLLSGAILAGVGAREAEVR